MSATPPKHPLIIAHRGASGERPEHTRAAYELAIAQGADFIEPDLVLSKDGVLVCRHENEISGTTDVAARAEFAARRTMKVVDGVETEGWFAEDFTLAELKTLRCRERLPELRPRNTAYDGWEPILTFAEVLAIAREGGVGIYPELKHPSFLREQGLDPLPAFIAEVHRAGGQAIADRMFVQCFETGPLVALAQMSSIRWRCVQLIAAEGGPWDRPDLNGLMTTEEGLRGVAAYAQGIGVEKTLILPRDSAGASTAPTDLIARAHALGLAVHAWTFRAENNFLPIEWRRGDAGASNYLAQHGDLNTEIHAFLAAGVDGVFSDFPLIAAEAARA